MPDPKQRGQALVILAVAMVGLLALAGMAIDGGNMAAETIHARDALNVACVDGAKASWAGNNGYGAFASSLELNGIHQDAYFPNEGTGASLTQGWEFDQSSPTVRTALAYDIPTYLVQLVGIRSLPIRVQERCTTAGAFITPIAVKSSAFQRSKDTGLEIAVVGQGSQADIDSGENYRGVVFPFIWCVESSIDFSPNTNCPYAAPFWPLYESPPSAQTAKNELADHCWYGGCNRIFPPVGMRLATVSGTSDNQLCKAATDAGLMVGTEFVAIIYDGEVVSPDPGYGAWENVGVLGWGKFIVTDTPPNENNCNSLVAVATGGVYSTPQELGSLYPREIPWNAIGGWE